MKSFPLFGFAAILSVTACASPPDASTAQSDEEATTTTSYEFLTDFPGADVDGFYGAGAKLAKEFASVCGDTFCEGDFSNLTPLSFTCSVTSKLGEVHDCAWTFAGSTESVDPSTSAITTDAVTYQCHVHPKTTGAKLVTLLNNSADALHETLPGTTGSIYDALGDCFAHPIGATPITFPTEPTPSYVEASDYYSSAKGQASWAAAKTAAQNGFNNICGDTFCGSDFGDLQSVALVCSITKSTGNVKDCKWVFGGSYSGIDKTGAVVPTSKTFTCDVAMKGTLGQYVGVLTATGTDNPIQRTLPGETTSTYDAIGTSCLP